MTTPLPHPAILRLYAQSCMFLRTFMVDKVLFIVNVRGTFKVNWQFGSCPASGEEDECGAATVCF